MARSAGGIASKTLTMPTNVAGGISISTGVVAGLLCDRLNVDEAQNFNVVKAIDPREYK